MSEKRYCPECGHELEPEERFCSDCGADTSAGHSPKEETVAETGDNDGNASVIGQGARANIMGSVNTSNTSNTTNNTQNNTQNTTTLNTQTNHSTVDNSSTIHNTTIVMGGKNDAEYCEVCGNPLGEKHARCPKCGRKICFDCKTKNKNRCIECEKKAVNEYRIAFQQLLLTTGCNIGIAGRQMMDQKARDLDVEDVKQSIEKELTELYKPAPKAAQPDIIQSGNSHTAAIQSDNTKPQTEAKFTPQSLVNNTGNSCSTTKNGNSGKKTGSLIVYALIACVIVGVVLYLTLPGDDSSSKTEPQPAKTETVDKAKEEAAPVKKQEEVVKKVQETAAPTPSKKVVNSQIVKVDEKYNAGLKAYNSGDGLEAVRLFKESGSAESYYMLGEIYEKGCGSVGKNAMMARKYYKKGAEMGSEKAKAKL